jgi:hypothetical protein
MSFAASEAEALELKQRIASERRRGIIIDYGLARRTTFADLLIRYLHEESPRHKSFEIEGYKINAILEDAGLPRQDFAAIWRQPSQVAGQAYAEAVRHPHERAIGGQPVRAQAVR